MCVYAYGMEEARSRRVQFRNIAKRLTNAIILLISKLTSTGDHLEMLANGVRYVWLALNLREGIGVINMCHLGNRSAIITRGRDVRNCWRRK